jgi:hypothetical protein
MGQGYGPDLGVLARPLGPGEVRPVARIDEDEAGRDGYRSSPESSGLLAR